MLALALVLLLASAHGLPGASAGGQLRGGARHHQLHHQSRRRLRVDSASAKALLPPLQAPRADLHDKLARSFHKSGDLGIARCSLLGVLEQEDVTLHIWLRFAPPSVVAPRLCAQPGADQHTCKRTAIVRGFALLQSSRLSVPSSGRFTGMQMLQAGSIDHFSRAIYLRSYVSRTEYHLNVTLATSKRARPWNASEPSEGWTNHVMDLTGHLVLKHHDVEQGDFELRALGFDWHCPILVEPPVLGYRAADQGPFKYPGAELRTDSNGEATPASAAAAAAAEDAGDAQTGRGRAGAKHPAWDFHLASSLGPDTKAWQLLSPFYRVATHDYAVMLWHRVLWHSQMGIHKYLLYVYESLSPLMREPLIQDLVAQGYLEVVFFNEMPKHEREPLRPSYVDVYTLQVLAYNHALLALWGSDSLVLVADVDEYLVTHRPMSAVQAFVECRNTTLDSGLPSAGLQIRRTDALCAHGVKEEECSTKTPGLVAWTGVNLHDVRSGKAPHPLSWHAMNAGLDLWDHHNTKTMVEPNLVRDMHVHFFMGSANVSSRDNASTDCMRLLHLVDLYKVRHSKMPQLADSAAEGNTGWWWPVQRINADAPGPRISEPGADPAAADAQQQQQQQGQVRRLRHSGPSHWRPSSSFLSRWWRWDQVEA